jgi:hypothetical protein
MDVWYDIVEKDKKRQRIKLIVYSSFLLPLATTPFAPDCPGVCPYSIGMASSMLIWVIAMMYMNFFFSTFKTKGILRFQDDHILILENKYALEIVKQLKININSYEGQNVGRYPSEGCDNILTLNLDTGSFIQITFRISNKRETIIIPRFLKVYKNKGMVVKLFKENKEIPI